jgi:hypothetical protein
VELLVDHDTCSKVKALGPSRRFQCERLLGAIVLHGVKADREQRSMLVNAPACAGAENSQ